MKKFLLFLFVCLNFAYSYELSGNVSTEYKLDVLKNSKYKSSDKDKKVNGYLDVDIDFDFDFQNNFHLIGAMEFTPMFKRNYNGSMSTNDYYSKEMWPKRKPYFNHYGLSVEELYFKYKEEAFLFGIGKYNPTFGHAYNSNRLTGVYGTRLAKEYKLTEKIGTFIAFDSEFFILRGNFFFDDKTFLSEDVFRRRGINKSEYGAGNTEKLNSFSISSDFIYNTSKITTSFRRLAVGRGIEKAEKGYLFAFQKYIKENQYGFGMNPLIEFAYFDNFKGVQNRDVFFSTINLPFFYKGWNLVGSYTFKNDHEEKFKNYQSYLTQLSIGYKFENGLTVDIARKWEKYAKKLQNLVDTKKVKHYHSWGIEVGYNFMF